MLLEEALEITVVELLNNAAKKQEDATKVHEYLVLRETLALLL